MSTDHPGLPFVPAKYFRTGRPDGPPLWIVIHDMEASEYSGRAESSAAYFANPSDGRVVSSHYCVDDDSVVQCVALGDVAYTVGNRPGNYRGINWELAGFARQTEAEWLDPFGVAMFNRMAPYVRADAQRYSIPLRRCSGADLLAFRPGITSHNDLRIAFGVTDHTDPGPAFPWDYFMALLMEDEMTPQQALIVWNTGWFTQRIAEMADPIVIPAHAATPAEPWTAPGATVPNMLAKTLKAIAATAGMSDAEYAKLLADTTAAAQAGAAAGVAASTDEIADAVADEQAQRLAG